MSNIGAALYHIIDVQFLKNVITTYFVGGCNMYELTAPSDGTKTVIFGVSKTDFLTIDPIALENSLAPNLVAVSSNDLMSTEKKKKNVTQWKKKVRNAKKITYFLVTFIFFDIGQSALFKYNIMANHYFNII